MKPGEHSVHTLLPVPVAYVPAGHSWQVPWLVAEA